ncbi:hypothetical protein KK141_13400 [Dyella sp. LX-66]|uniref:hypothetical protein n=1 Tax=unclassified Dyella TaxID=2634549 RepID=UPI001BE0C8C4|nr:MULTISPECIES: hypothetical protein [unclassified Dyella]MBT2116523.1 hypothetical protein [Dyella sp. LX-1]MBT2140534.1 hypothetical protein [Dyella sp. LX-66]
MSDIIEFLERMGEDARLRDAPAAELELALAGARLEPAHQAVLLARDSAGLQALLGLGALMAVQLPAEEEEEEQEDEGEGDEPSPAEDSLRREAAVA